MNMDEQWDILQLLRKLSVDDKIQLISFLRDLRGNECSPKLPASSQEVG